MEKIIEEQIMRGVANQIAIQKAMGHDITDVDCLDMLEKAGRAAQIGDIRTWGGKDYIKTPKGWRPIPAGFKPSTKEEKNEAGEKKNDDWKVTPKSVTDKLKVGDHVMYAGKEMILTRISKDGRFDSGIEMKFANEGDKTPTGSTTKVGNMQYAKPVGGEKKDDEKREYASMDINEAKKELVGKKITFKEYFSDGRGGYKDGEGEIKNVRLYGKGKQPIAEIDFPNGDGITISLDQLDKRRATGYKIEFGGN